MRRYETETAVGMQIDAALDTANVERIADYLAAQHGAQHLLVTHRPQVRLMASLQCGQRLIHTIVWIDLLEVVHFRSPAAWLLQSAGSMRTQFEAEADIPTIVAVSDVREGGRSHRGVPILRRLQGSGAALRPQGHSVTRS